MFRVWYLFFFCVSSRRRHTRCALVTGVQTCALLILATFLVRAHRFVTGETLPLDDRWFRDRDPVHGDNVDRTASAGIATGFSNGTYRPQQIGRASCRERVCQYV